MQAAAASNSTLVPCYCADIDAVEFLTTSMCLRYFETAARGIALQHVASIAVAVFNLVIAYISKKLAGLECHRSLDGLHLAFAQRLLLSSFVNTALLTLLVNAKVGGQTFFGGSGFDDFTIGWFQQVGVSMSVTMISQIFVPVSCLPGISGRRDSSNVQAVACNHRLSALVAAFAAFAVVSAMVYSVGVPSPRHSGRPHATRPQPAVYRAGIPSVDAIRACELVVLLGIRARSLRRCVPLILAL